MYSAALSVGAALGALIAGLMSISQDWRKFHYLCAGLVLTTTVLIFFTMPETAYYREVGESGEEIGESKTSEVSMVENVQADIPSKKSAVQLIAFNLTPLTHESIWKIAFRPVHVILLPPVLWSTVSFGIGIGIFVVISTTAANAFIEIYLFSVWEVGLVWIGSIIGSLLGMPLGGYFSDWVANRATFKNGGIREPEMRLPAVSLAMLCYPGSLLLYGLGIHYKAHWMVPVLGIFLCKTIDPPCMCSTGVEALLIFEIVSFGSSAAIGISVVYTIDSYRPIAGEVVVSQVAFKCMLFHTHPASNCLSSLRD